VKENLLIVNGFFSHDGYTNYIQFHRLHGIDGLGDGNILTYMV